MSNMYPIKLCKWIRSGSSIGIDQAVYRHVMLPFSPHKGAGIGLDTSQEDIVFVNTHFNAQKQELEAIVWCQDDRSVARRNLQSVEHMKEQIEVVVQDYEDRGWLRNLGESWF